MLNRKCAFFLAISLFLLQLIVNSRPAFSLPAARSQAGQESAYQEIKRKFNIDMEKWLKGPAGELPDTISNLKLNLPGSEYYFADWESRPYGKGLILHQRNMDKNNLGQVVENDKGTIVLITHTIKNETEDYIRALLRYAKERYGAFFLEYYPEAGMDNHHFKQLMPERGISRSLIFVSNKDSIAIQIRQDFLASLPETEKGMSTFLSKDFPDLKPEAYSEEGVVNFYYIIRSKSVDDAYFSRLFLFAGGFTRIEKSLHPGLTDWTRSKAFFLFHGRLALGWILAADLAAAYEIKEATAKQQFILQKFHNTFTYFTNEFGKNP